MKYSRLLLFFFMVVVCVATSCKDDAYLTEPPLVSNQSFTEEFDTIQNAFNRGWRFMNRSLPIGASNVGNWKQGATFPAYSSRGTSAGCVSADYQSTTADIGIISNWIVSPAVTMQNGDRIIFYTRSLLYPVSATDSSDFANRLQLRINTTNDGLNIGNGASVGDFTTKLLDIDSTYQEFHTSPALYSPIAYPGRWTRFEGVIKDLPQRVRGRFAFRYFITQGGSNGRGSEVAIDSVAYVSIQ